MEGGRTGNPPGIMKGCDHSRGYGAEKEDRALRNKEMQMRGGCPAGCGEPGRIRDGLEVPA